MVESSFSVFRFRWVSAGRIELRLALASLCVLPTPKLFSYPTPLPFWSFHFISGVLSGIGTLECSFPPWTFPTAVHLQDCSCLLIKNFTHFEQFSVFVFFCAVSWPVRAQCSADGMRTLCLDIRKHRWLLRTCISTEQRLDSGHPSNHKLL